MSVVAVSLKKTFPAAISRSAITISRFFDSTSGLAPFKSCFARIDASNTRSKRLETLSKQSSTVILAMANTVGLGIVEHKNNFCSFAVLTAASAASLNNRQRSQGVSPQRPTERVVHLFFARQPCRRNGLPKCTVFPLQRTF